MGRVKGVKRVKRMRKVRRVRRARKVRRVRGLRREWRVMLVWWVPEWGGDRTGVQGPVRRMLIIRRRRGKGE